MTQTRIVMRGLIAGLALLLPTLAQAQGGDEVFYFVTDAIGSVRMVTDASGAVVGQYDYVPFGQNWDPTTVSDPRQFALGDERGSSLQNNLDYFGARYYQGQNGRFITADDQGFMDPYDPQSMNRYAYAYNNPLRYVHPTGHDGDCVGGYDTKTGRCEPAPELWGIGWSDPTFLPHPLDIAKPVINWVTAPRDPKCMGAAVGIGASVMGVAGGILGATGGGAAGASAGSFAAPGVGTIGGGFGGATAGFVQGTALGTLAGGSVGGAVGSIVCQIDGGGAAGGSGGGGGGDDWEHLTADQIISRYKQGSVRQVFPGQYLNKTLAQIRQLAAQGDKAARTALKLLIGNRFNK